MFARTLTMTCFVAAALAAYQPAIADDDDAGTSRFHRFVKQSTTAAPVVAIPATPGDPFVELDGTSVLNRTKTGVGFVFNATELEPNAPYTIWWVTFNRPRRCFTPYQCGADDLGNAKARPGVFFATGRLADAHGQATFAGQVDYGELPDGEDQVPFPELDRPVLPGAEIHLVIRAHGPALDDPEALTAQLTQFDGGCPPNACADIQFSVHPAKQLRLY